MKRLGRFDLHKPVARGGFATVVLGTDTATGRSVAVKLVPRTGSANMNAVVRFRRETVVLTLLDHPNLVKILDAGETETHLYYVMPFIEGGRLGSMLRQLGRPFPVERTVALCRDLADALAYIHGQGILHRDLKPDNVMIDADGRTVLMDFGLIKLAGGTNMTREGELVGTLVYVCPEAFRQAELTPASDLYQLGILMDYCLTGRRPIDEKGSMEAVMHRILERTPVPPSRLNPAVPPWLDALVLACTQPDPAARPQTAAEVLQALSTESFDRT